MEQVSLSQLAEQQAAVLAYLDGGKELLLVSNDGRSLGVLVHPDRHTLLEEVAGLASNPRTFLAFVSDPGSKHTASYEDVFGRDEDHEYEPYRPY